MTVQLAVLPEKRVTRIVVGTTVRKPADVLTYYFRSLLAQELPPNTELYFCFVDDNVDGKSRETLHKFVEGRGEVLRGLPSPVADFADAGVDSHQWSDSAMNRVGANKDRIIARARELNADYLWFIDADLICDRTTLKSLLGCRAPIATAVYWTRWSQRAAETRQIHAGPQVWLKHPYTLSGMGIEEHEFRSKLANRQVVPVPGYGACTLIDRRALDAGVSFVRVPGVPATGLMAGEDRHFCIRAQQLHLQSVADAWPDIFHIYHLPADLAFAAEYSERLNVTHADTPSFGDLVSLTLEAIEPLPYAGGGFTAVPPQHLRGRIGALALVPELEEAVYGLKRGDSVTVPVHFPTHYEVPFYRGRRRLIKVTLHDCKPHGFAPVLEDEMLVGPRSRAAVRTVDFTTRQLDGMREVANG